MRIICLFLQGMYSSWTRNCCMDLKIILIFCFVIYFYIIVLQEEGGKKRWGKRPTKLKTSTLLPILFLPNLLPIIFGNQTKENSFLSFSSLNPWTNHYAIVSYTQIDSSKQALLNHNDLQFKEWKSKYPLHPIPREVIQVEKLEEHSLTQSRK